VKTSQLCTHIAMAKLRNTTLAELKDMLKDEDFSQPSDFERYPIHEIAAIEWDMVDFAVERGADVNVKTDMGHTPLEIAIPRGNVDVVASLLRHGAKIDVVDRFGNSPLFSAILKGTKAYKIVDMLLDAGANPNLETKNGSTPKSLAIELNHPCAGRM